jgi:hypothetical protein
MIGGYEKALLGDGPNTIAKFAYQDWECRQVMKVDLTGRSL